MSHQTCESPPYVAGHLVGGAIAMRFAIEHGDRVRGLALVDTHGLHRLRPTPAFSLTLITFLARPTAGEPDRFFRQCFVDMPGLQQQLGALWSPLMSLALQGAGSPEGKQAVRSLMSHFGMRAIQDDDLLRRSGLRAAGRRRGGAHCHPGPELSELSCAERAELSGSQSRPR